MRILVGGINPVQTGHRPKLDYVSSVQALMKSLAVGNHEVEIRPVVVGEDLSKYDRVVVFVAPMRGFLAIHTLGALWALYAAQGKCTVSFDDWQVVQALYAIKAFAAQREQIIEKNPFGYRQIDKVPEFRDKLWQALDALIADEWKWPVLMPLYKGGDVSMFGLPKANIFSYNPSVLFKGVYGWVDQRDTSSTKKEWTLSALHNHEPWLKKQGVTWPVTQFGHRKSKQERLPESELFKRTCECWGSLSPKYKISGSGWWRARYGFAADALICIAGDPKEVAMIDSSCYLPPAEVEKLTDAGRLDLAKAQREAYYKAAGTPESMYEDVMAALR